MPVLDRMDAVWENLKPRTKRVIESILTLDDLGKFETCVSVEDFNRVADTFSDDFIF